MFTTTYLSKDPPSHLTTPFLPLENFILSRWLGFTLIFSIPNEICRMVGMKDGDVFSTHCEIQGKKIILKKIDREQLLDHHHQAEGE